MTAVWILLAAAGIVLLAVLLCYVAVEIYAYPRVFKKLDKLPHNEFGLVLGTSPVRRDGGPNRYFSKRVDAAVELYHAGKVEKFILSGDKHEGYNEPAAMRDALVGLGVPAENCLLDGNGYDTIDSILNARSLFGARTYTIISQDFHCERAVTLAGCCGIRAVAWQAAEVEPFRRSQVKQREIPARVKLFKDILILKLNKRI